MYWFAVWTQLRKLYHLVCYKIKKFSHQYEVMILSSANSSWLKTFHQSMTLNEILSVYLCIIMRGIYGRVWKRVFFSVILWRYAASSTWLLSFCDILSQLEITLNENILFIENLMLTFKFRIILLSKSKTFTFEKSNFWILKFYFF